MRTIVVTQEQVPYFEELLNILPGKVVFSHDLAGVEDRSELVVMQSTSIVEARLLHSFDKLCLFNTEQLSRPAVLKDIVRMIIMDKVQCVYDYSAANAALLQKVLPKLPIVVLDFITPQAAELKRLLRKPAKYDLAFVGTMSPRRQAVLDELALAGLSIHVVVGFGRKRDKAIAKCRALLNIHYENDYTVFEKPRCMQWMNAGLPVITEANLDDPVGEKVLVLPYNDFFEAPEKVVAFLKTA